MMVRKISNNQPHDAFFKSVMQHEEVARAFIETHLPAEVLAKMDLSALSLESTEFIQSNLGGKRYVDTLYCIPYGDQSSYVYFVAEHLSRGDWLMPLRIWEYMLAIMRRSVEKKGSKTLPLVFAVVIHNGKKPYSDPTNFFHLFHERDRAAAMQSFNGIMPLIDVTQLSDEQLSQNPLLTPLLLTLKHVRVSNFEECINILGEHISPKVFTALEFYVQSMVHYLLSQYPNLPDKELSQIAGRLSIEEDKMRTIADRLREEGMEKGRQQGLQQGLQEGMKQAQQRFIKMARLMLEQGMSDQQILLLTELTPEELDNIKKSDFN